MSEPPARINLPLEAFPISMELIEWRTGEVLWEKFIEAPADVARVRIPGRAELNAPVIARMTLANGEVHQSPPPPETIPA